MRHDSWHRRLIGLISRRRPKHEELKLTGLTAPVRVHFDSRGVPHIHAGSRRDAFLAQGYVTARDRLFQLDYTRHGAQGRLCELVGLKSLPWRSLTAHLRERTTLDADRFVRSFGLAEAARGSTEKMSADAREVAEAYAAGVSAWIAEGNRPLEHRMLGVRDIAPWRAYDSVTVLKAMAFELCYAWRAILLQSTVMAQCDDADVAACFVPHTDGADAPIVSDWKPDASFLELAGAGGALSAGAGVAGGAARGVGSNAFVVSGERSASGSAMLANDTHLTNVIPSPWYEVGIHAPDLDLHGFALSGVPGVGIGRNAKISWGITAGLVQDLDIFAERSTPESQDAYLTPDGSLPFEVVEETFHIKGKDSVTEQRRRTRHGPVLAGLSSLPSDDHAYAVKWTGHLPSSELDALLGIWKAESFSEFREAATHHACPTFSLVYGDREGNIGYCLAGAVPKRRANTPLRPLEGWTGDWDWLGVHDQEANPHQYNPECGYIVSANNRVVSGSSGVHFGDLFEPAQRYNRIVSRLTEIDELLTLDMMEAVQADCFSDWGGKFAEALQSWMAEPVFSSPMVRDAYHAWKLVDATMACDAGPSAVMVALVPRFFAQRVLSAVTDATTVRMFLEMGSLGSHGLLTLATHPEWLERNQLDPQDIARESVVEAAQFAARNLGERVDAWRWGALHGFYAKHRFDSTPIGWFFSLGPDPCGGGADTVRRGDMTSADDAYSRVNAAVRWVVDAGAGMSRSVLPGGQSGVPTSRHYADQLSAYLQDNLLESHFSVDEMNSVASWTLRPKPARATEE